MPTITLSKSKINQMSGLINSVKTSVNNYKDELTSLKTKTFLIDRSACNLDDVISSIKTSTQTQEDKADSLKTLKSNINDFISDVVRIDGDAADAINKSKDDFYDTYYYLKPECEKSDWEKFKDGLKKVGEWCKEHWRAIVKIVIVVVIIAALAIATVLTGGVTAGLAGFIIAGALKGAVFGAVFGAIIGGGIAAFKHYFSTGSCNGIGNAIFDGAADGFFSGAITGAIFGAAGSGIKAFQLSKFGKLSWGSSGFNPNNYAVVSRWGRTGLRSGDWVMKGSTSWKNYILSGKWDFISPTNQFARKGIGQSFVVLKDALVRPSGKGIDGIVKIIVDQWKYIP